MKNIPRIIHQTWKSTDVPEPMQRLANTWKQRHPDWTYKLWTDADNRRLVKEHYPELLERYDSYPHAIQRVDMARYLLLHKCGGLYVDLDFECLHAVDDLLADRHCVFGLEPAEHCAIHRRERIIGNAFIASVPGHEFLDVIARELYCFTAPAMHRNDEILNTTGPFMVDRVYERCGLNMEVTLLPAKLLYPLSIHEIEEITAQGWTGKTRAKTRAAFAVHYHSGTWWRPSHRTNERPSIPQALEASCEKRAVKT